MSEEFEEDEWAEEPNTCANVDPEELEIQRERAKAFQAAIENAHKKFGESFRRLAEN